MCEICEDMELLKMIAKDYLEEEEYGNRQRIKRV